ncbi:MAG: HNH endonuclease, partial [Acidimicrobiales bacterium]|nr:HNH endonuclease [Acidimicrobiales bacterium]
RGAPEHAELADGTPLAAETARRLACDGRAQLVLTDERGRPVGVGRVTRTVPPWLMRLLHQRDHGCRFPGCGRQTHLHGHHIEHWARGGSTDLQNLVLLCPHHHRLVHAELRFLHPDGRPYRTGPPGLDPAVRRRFGEAA